MGIRGTGMPPRATRGGGIVDVRGRGIRPGTAVGAVVGMKDRFGMEPIPGGHGDGRVRELEGQI